MKNLIKNQTITIKKPNVADILNGSEKLAKGVSRVSSIVASLALSCIIINISANVIYNNVGRPLLKKFGKNNEQPEGSARLVAILKREKLNKKPADEEPKEVKPAEEVAEDEKKN